MPSSSKELKNIPVSISILHEQEYDNVCLMITLMKNKAGRRRAFSERSSTIDKPEEKEKDIYKSIHSKLRIGSLSLKNK
jgi:hypothetical protein